MTDVMAVLLLFSVQHIVTLSGAPTVSVPSSNDVVKMKSKVKWMAEQLVVKLNKGFQVPPNLTPASHVDDLDGLTSIVSVLDDYSGLLADTLGGVSAIKAEVSSLTGYLRHWGEEQLCGEEEQHSPSERIQKLRGMRTRFGDSVSIEAINSLKTILNLLIKSLEMLETC